MSRRKTLLGVAIAGAALWSVYWGSRYFYGKRLDAGDYQHEQSYLIDRAFPFTLAGLAVLLALLLLLRWKGGAE